MLVGGEKICIPCDAQGGETMTEKIVEGEGPINQEGAICPNCGLIINMEDINNPADVACPNCGADMARRPQKTVEQIGELAKEEIIELFRPPFNGDLMSYNKRFKKTTGEKLKTSTIPSVGAVDGATIGIVEATKLEAQKSEYELKLTKQADNHMAEVKKLNEKIAVLNEELSDQKKINAKGDTLQSMLTEKTDEISNFRTEVKQLKGTIRASNENYRSLESKFELIEADKSQLVEDHAAIKKRLEDKITEHQRDLVKSAENAQLANNEIQNRARLQEEVSGLREEIAKLTRKYSNLTEKSYNESKRLQELETEVAGKIKLVQTTKDFYEAQLEENRQLIVKARTYQKWSEKALKKAGLVRVAS